MRQPKLLLALDFGFFREQALSGFAEATQATARAGDGAGILRLFALKLLITREPRRIERAGDKRRLNPATGLARVRAVAEFAERH